MVRIVLGLVGITAMIVAGFLDPEHRPYCLLFVFFGSLGTFNAFRKWQERRADQIRGWE